VDNKATVIEYARWYMRTMTTFRRIACSDAQLSLGDYATDIDERLFSLWYLSGRQPAAVIVEYVERLAAVRWGDRLSLAQRNAIWEDIEHGY